MWSDDGHKPDRDGYPGVKPVIIIEENQMTVVWGDNKRTTPGDEKVWKAVVFHRTPEMISAVTVDQGPAGSSSMLYSIDVKRRYLYMSAHKNVAALGGSGTSAFVSKCPP